MIVIMHEDSPTSVIHACLDAIEGAGSSSHALDALKNMREKFGEAFVRQQVAAYVRENYRINKIRDRVLASAFRVS